MCSLKGHIVKLLVVILLLEITDGETAIRTGGGTIVRRSKLKIRQPLALHQSVLLNRLLDKYNVLSRPEFEPSEPLIVSLRLSVRQLLGVDDAVGVISTRSWVTMLWIDKNLVWDPKDYGNISTLQIPIHRIWNPEVLPLNAQQNAPVDTPCAIVRSNGSVSHTTPSILSTSCVFSNDTEVTACDITFGSFSYSSEELDIQLMDGEGSDLTSYVKSSDWDVIGNRLSGKRQLTQNDFSEDPFVEVTFTLRLKRRTR